MQGSQLPGKKIHAWENHGILKKGHFHGIFASVFPIFLNIRIHFAEFILCTSVPSNSLIFDYWWLHIYVPKSFDVRKQFRKMITI